MVTFEKNIIDKSADYYQFQLVNNIRLRAKQPIHGAEISLKKIMDNWTFNLQLRDVFGTNRNRIYGEDGSGNYNSVNQNPYNRQLVFTATYNFGNQKLQKVRKAEGANDDIKNRTGGN